MRRIFVLIGLICIFGSHANPLNDDEVLVLTERPQFKRNPDEKSILDIWKYEGEAIHPLKLWKTVQVDIVFSQPTDLDCVIYQSVNKSEILQLYTDNQRFITNFLRRWSSNWRPSSYLPLFNEVFVGVESHNNYAVRLRYKNVDYVMAALFISGIAMFFAAKRLSRSTIAFYAGGTTVGVIGSLLVVVFFLYKLAPKRSVAASILVGGWSVTGYVIYVVWQHFYTLLSDYYRYVAVYLVSVAAISFAVSYFRGPPQGIRTLNLIQWTLQLVGLLLIYCGCQIPALSAATIICLVLVANIPQFVYERLLRLWRRFFRPKHRFLTEDEYIAQGARETHRALDELRKYCQSPDCNAWRTISRLSSPQQFADFISNKRSHISDDEILRYSNESEIDDHQDDDDEEDESDQSIDEELATSNGFSQSYALRNRSRFYESFTGRQSLPSSAPEKSQRPDRFTFKPNQTFNGGV